MIINLDAVAQRIRSQCPSFKLVAGAVDFERAQKGLTTLPAAFVLFAQAKAESSPFMDGVVQQQVGFDFSVALAVRNLADSQGKAAVDELQPVCQPLLDALLGWAPSADCTGCEFSEARLLDFINGVLWVGTVFSTTTVIRSV